MKVKKFIAANMPEALNIIRKDLGEDAVILNSREIETGGFFGLFAKKNIEVIAAIDPTPTIKRPLPASKQTTTKQIEETGQREQKINKQEQQLFQEIQQLKRLVTSMAHEKTNAPYPQEYPEPFQKVNDFLEEQEVEKVLRLQLMKTLLKKWYESEKKTLRTSEAFALLTEHIASLIRDIPLGGIDFQKKYVNIIGPTGVGKTTTIAKIAAHCVLKKHKKVALITTDTYRIAAVEQLKTYAKILNIPLEVAYSIDDFLKAKEQFSNYDLVLVDSAGRNFLNNLYVKELKKVIDFNDDVETYLVLALTSKYRDMEAIFQKFSFIPIDKLIFTKKDETSYYGNLLNMIIRNKVGIAYVTTGQNVPDDIIEVSDIETITALFEVSDDE